MQPRDGGVGEGSRTTRDEKVRKTCRKIPTITHHTTINLVSQLGVANLNADSRSAQSLRREKSGALHSLIIAHITLRCFLRLLY